VGKRFKGNEGNGIAKGKGKGEEPTVGERFLLQASPKFSKFPKSIFLRK
jgi:hypothetical protein